MYKTISYFVILLFAVLLNACDNSSDFQDIEEAIKLNKLNIRSIEVDATRTITIANANGDCSGSNPCNTYLPTSKTEPFIAYGFTPDNKKIDVTNEVQWSTSNSSMAQVSQSGSLTTQTTVGDVDVIATLGNVSGRTTVTVSPEVLSDNNVIFTHDNVDVGSTSPQVDACDAYGLVMVGQFADSKRIITQDFKWNIQVASGDPKDAKISTTDGSNQALFSSHTVPPEITPGTAVPYTLTATYTNSDASTATGTLDIVINDVTGSTIAVSPSSQSVSINANYQFTATKMISGVSTNVTSTAKWVTNPTTYASVNDLGVVTGVAKGTSTLTATCGSVTSNEASVDVTDNPNVARLSLTDTNNTDVGSYVKLYSNDTTKNKTEDLKVIVTYVDSSTADVTADVENATTNPVSIETLYAETTGTNPVSSTFEPASDLNSNRVLRIQGDNPGIAIVTIKYLGLVYYLTVQVF